MGACGFNRRVFYILASKLKFLLQSRPSLVQYGGWAELVFTAEAHTATLWLFLASVLWRNAGLLAAQPLLGQGIRKMGAWSFNLGRLILSTAHLTLGPLL